MTTFINAFGYSPALAWRAPGRINVIGEHTDYNDGFVLPTAIPHGVTARVAPRSDDMVRIASAQIPGTVVSVELSDLTPGAVTGGAANVAGIVWELVRRGLAAHGVDIHVDGDVRQGAGLSSSAALECAVAGALNELFGLGLGQRELVHVAHRAENDFVGMPCGVMDQSAAMLSQPGHLLFLDTRDMTTRHVPASVTEYRFGSAAEPR